MPAGKTIRGIATTVAGIAPVDKPLDRVSIDLTNMLAGAQGYRYVLTVLDHCIRYTKLYPLKTKNTEEVTEAFQGFITDFGTPHTVLLDSGG